MRYVFTPMSDADAREILSWRYEAPYDIYNADPNNMEQDLAWFLDPQYAYSAIHSEADQLVGFCNFGKDAQVPGGSYELDALDVGAGLKPELTGQGSGLEFINAILEFASTAYQPHCFRATVAGFNQRCIQMCQNAGFEVLETFIGQAKSGSREYLILVKKA